MTLLHYFEIGFVVRLIYYFIYHDEKQISRIIYGLLVMCIWPIYVIFGGIAFIYMAVMTNWMENHWP